MDRIAPTRTHQDLPRRVGESLSTASLRRWQRAHALWICVQHHVSGGVRRMPTPSHFATLALPLRKGYGEERENLKQKYALCEGYKNI